MELRLPWRTIRADRNGRARWRCYLAMLAHEFLFEPWGQLTGRPEHARPNRWTTRYAIGIPTTYPPPALRETFLVIADDNDLADIPVVDGALLFYIHGSTQRVGATGNLVGVYRGNVGTNKWERFGSGGQQATYEYAIVTPGNYNEVTAGGVTQPLDGGALTGNGNFVVSIPVTTYVAGDVIGGVTFSVAGLPDSDGEFSIGMVINVSSADGANRIQIGGASLIAAHTSSGSFNPADLANQGTLGTDLTFEGTSISTTAGGEFGILVTFTLGWF